MEQYPDIIKDYWKKYIELDYFDQREYLKKLQGVDLILKMDTLTCSKTMKDYIILSAFQSYINDLIYYFERYRCKK